MKLKLLAPFKTNFYLVPETPIIHTAKYQEFWEQVQQKLEKQELSFNGKEKAPLDWEWRLLHTSRYYQSASNRYQHLAHNTLNWSVHLLEIHCQDIPAPIRQGLYEEIQKTFEHTKEKEGLLNSLHYLLFKSEIQILIRVFDYGIALLELDCNLKEHVKNEVREDKSVSTFLDQLRLAGIALTTKLAKYSYLKCLRPFFKDMREQLPEETEVIQSSFTSKLKEQKTIGDSLWVTRTLIFEPKDRFRKKLKNEMISYWLKDTFYNSQEDDKKKNIISETINNPKAHQMKWVNYIFREGAYPKDAFDPGSELARPFSNEWEAMVYAQFFYAALEIVDFKLTKILAIALAEETEFTIEQLKGHLEHNIQIANMLIIKFYDSLKYYKRSVKAKLDEINKSWSLEDSLIRQVKLKLQLCQERFNVLVKKEEAKSALNREIILMAFSITAIFGTGIALAEYGRTMAADADLARFDISSTNFIDYFAGQSTDVILLLSGAFSFLIVGLYLFFRKRHVV